jgi:hypothetical protein
LAEKGSFLVKNRQKFNKTAEDAEGAEEYRRLRNCYTSPPCPLSLRRGGCRSRTTMSSDLLVVGYEKIE